MAGPQGNDFFSVPLTNFSIGIMEREPSIARRLLPRVPVDQQTAQYYVIPRGDWLRNQAKPLARSSESAGGAWTLSEDTYNVTPRAFHKDNDDQDYLNASAQRIINLDQSATRFVTSAITVAEDVQFADTYLSSTANAWTVERTGSGTPTGTQFLFWDDANSTPLEDIDNAAITITRATGGRRPNTLIVPPAVHSVLRRHPTVVQLYQYTSGGNVTDTQLAQAFGVENYVVAWGVVNAAAEGAADDIDFFLGENVLLAYFNSAAGPENQTAGALFSWTGYDGGGGGNAVRIDRYRIPEKHVYRIEGFDAVDMKVTDAAAGVLFKDTLT